MLRKLGRLLGGGLLPFLLLSLLFAAGAAALTLFLPRVFAPVWAAERVGAAFAALAVANGRDLPAVRTAKLFLLLFPWTGIFLCLLVRSAPAPPPLPPLPSCGTETERAARLAESPLLFAESAEYFSCGGDMWRKLLCDVAAAKERVWLQFYIVAEGSLLSGLLGLLGERARAGVDVRLLYDGFGSALTLPRNFCKKLKKCGIAAKKLRPVRFPTPAANRRDHRKIAVVDGAAYTGGANLADEYAGRAIRFGNWKDAAVRLTGDPAEALASLFEETWTGKPQVFVPHSPIFGKNACAVFADKAELSAERKGARVLFRLLSEAREKLYLFTPYLALEKGFSDALSAAARAGVDVRIMIPHIPDKRAVFALTRENARRLAAAGVNVREYTAGFLHSKCAVADGRCAAVSSYNLDYRSLYSQAECGVFFGEGPLPQEVERDFLQTWETSCALPAASVWERAAAFFLRLFAPLI